MIQIGNEITNGMLWDSARADVWSQEWDTPGRWTYFCRVLSQASRACREVCPNAWVMVHIDRGETGKLPCVFNRMEQYRVDYDVIGLSYYPFWHGPLSGLRACLSGLQMNFRKNQPGGSSLSQQFLGYSTMPPIFPITGHPAGRQPL